MLKHVIIITGILCSTAISATVQACSFGGPVYALPLDINKETVGYHGLNMNLNAYLARYHGIKTWTFDEQQQLGLNIPEYTEFSVAPTITLPERCKQDMLCQELLIFSLSAITMVDKYTPPKEQKDDNGMTAISIGGDTHSIGGYKQIAHFKFEDGVDEIRIRIDSPERVNAIYTVLPMQSRDGGKTTYLVSGKKYTDVVKNFCGAQYWAKDATAAAKYNNKQWQDWNNYFYSNYDEYIAILGNWMEPYRLTNPVIYKDR